MVQVSMYITEATAHYMDLTWNVIFKMCLVQQAICLSNKQPSFVYTVLF